MVPEMNAAASDGRFARVRLIAFDLDGTLIDSSRDLIVAVNAARGRMGLKALDDPTVLSYIGQGARELMRQALGDGATEEQVEAGLRYFREYYAEHLLDFTRPYPGVVPALDRLQGRTLAVLTNKPLRFTLPIVEGLGLAPRFARIYGEDSFPRKKPDPMGMQALLAEFRVETHEALLVGDSEIDMGTARNAGTWACGVSYGLGSHRLHLCPPDLMISDMRQLPGELGS
jgi:phosphoglycolate phosphatase